MVKYIKIMKRLLGYSLVILFVQLFLNSCHTAIDNAITLYDSDIEDLSIDQLEKIVSLKPIKSKDLMKGVEFGLCFDEYFFLTSEDNTTLYCIVGDSVVATLNQQGRGYGEYLTINDYMFSKEDSVLYIMSQNQILKYKYPNFTFIESFKVKYNATAPRIVNDSVFIAQCDEYNNDGGIDYYFGLISTNTGEIVKKMADVNTCQSRFIFNDQVYENKGHLYYPVIDYHDFNFYSFHDCQLEAGTTYRYEKRWKIPNDKIVKDPSDMNQQIDFAMYLESDNMCFGGFYPIISNDTIMFWSFQMKDSERSNILNIVTDSSLKRYLFRIPGLTFDFYDYLCSGNGTYYYILPATADDIVDDATDMSPLASQIVSAIEKNEGNPVIMVLNFHSCKNE